MKSRRFLGVSFFALMVLMLGGATGVEPAAQTAPTTASAPAPSSAPTTQNAVDAAALRADGLKAAVLGRFDEAQKLLARAAATGGDELSEQALQLLRAYLPYEADWHAEREQELAMTVRRVRLSLLADATAAERGDNGGDADLALTTGSEAAEAPEVEVPDSVASRRAGSPASAPAKSLGEKLREQVLAVTTEYHKLADSEAMEQADKDAAEKMKTEALEALQKAPAAIDKAVALLRGDKGEYAHEFVGAAQRLNESFRLCGQMWRGVKTETLQDRMEAANKIAQCEDDLLDALADLEALTAKDPWRVGLGQGATAIEIADDKAALRQQDWCRQLVDRVKTLAIQAVAKADWNRAFAAYSGLEAIDDRSLEYKAAAKIVRRHVRVLSLYGRPDKNEKGDGGKPTTAPVRGWADLVRGVDVGMVQSAIQEVNTKYVAAVDYRALVRGALTAIQVLAETPQAAASFPALKNESKRREFLAEIQKAMDFANKDRVGEDDLILALNAVIWASERTVQIPTDVLAVEFTDGFLDELDRFSVLIWPSDVSDFEKSIKGRFFGIGVQISKEPGQPLKVVTPLPDTPAYRGGIKTGDLIVTVDGAATENLSIDDLVRRIMGPKGTKVVLGVKRPGWLTPKDFEIVRDEIHIRTVKGWERQFGGGWVYMIDPQEKIGYLRVEQFTEDTDKDAFAALDEMRQAGLKSLILDLRSNPGGLLQQAATLSNEFLRSGTIVSTAGRQVPRSEITANPGGRFLDGEMIVLVNSASASAAEIVSGAMKDWHRGLIVGERTYGKGSVQQVIPLASREAYLKLTTAYYYLPSGKLLHKESNLTDWGVSPDVAVPLTPKQARRWYSERRNSETIYEDRSVDTAHDLARQYDTDFQLRTAVLLVKLLRLQEQSQAATVTAAKKG